MANPKTVTIKSKSGNLRINESDFDPEQHELAEGSDAPAQDTQGGSEGEGTGKDDKGTQGGADSAASGLMVTKRGKKFIVIDSEGKPVERDGIESDGYGTEQAAWDAIVSLK